MHVRVDGVWHKHIAPWGELAWTSDERGCKDATWRFYLPPGVRHAALRRGALVEIMRGLVVVWSGFLDEPNWAEGTMSAKGFAYDAENFLARNGFGGPTSTPSDAVDAAITRGWRVTRGAGIPTTPFTTDPDASNTVGALLDSNADELGQRWSVRADRVVRMEADTATPSWHIRPGVVELGNTSDEYASSILVTYLDTGGMVATTTRSDADAAEAFDVKEFPLDLTPLGNMTLARAQGYADGLLAKGAARLGWTSAIDVTSHMMTTTGGVLADPALVASGQMARVFLGYDDVVALGGRTYLDVVIGSTQYAAGPDVLTIGPVGSVAQTLSEITAALTEEAAT